MRCALVHKLALQLLVIYAADSSGFRIDFYVIKAVFQCIYSHSYIALWIIGCLVADFEDLVAVLPAPVVSVLSMGYLVPINIVAS